MPQVQFEDNMLTVTGSLNDTTYRLTGAVSASGGNPRLDYSPAGPYTVTFESDVFVGCDAPPLFVYNPDSVSAPADPGSYTAIIEGPSPPYEIYVSRSVIDSATPILSEGYLSFSVDGPSTQFGSGSCEGRITFFANNISAEFKISDLGALDELVYKYEHEVGDYRYPLVSILPTTSSWFQRAEFGVREEEGEFSELEYYVYADNEAEELYVVGDVAAGDIVTVQVTPVPGGVEFKVNGTSYTVDVPHPSRVELQYGGMIRQSVSGAWYDHAVGVRNIVAEDL